MLRAIFQNRAGSLTPYARMILIALTFFVRSIPPSPSAAHLAPYQCGRKPLRPMPGGYCQSRRQSDAALIKPIEGSAAPFAELSNHRQLFFSLLSAIRQSAQDVHRDDCARAAGWVRDRLVSLRFRTRIRPTPGHPVVVGLPRTVKRIRKEPHVLFCSHYGVQPPDRWVVDKARQFEPPTGGQPATRRFMRQAAVGNRKTTTMFRRLTFALGRRFGRKCSARLLRRQSRRGRVVPQPPGHTIRAVRKTT